MQGAPVDRAALFAAVERSGVRALLIGRQALIALGLPVNTGDFDFWIDADGIESFNAALEPLDLHPTREPAEARARGRYVLENDERVDVIVARTVSTIDGEQVSFESLWQRRTEIDIGNGTKAVLPAIDDLIRTKRFAARPKDAEDIRLLEVLRSKSSP